MKKSKDQKRFFLEKLPWVLAIVLYVLIYFVRLEQGGWEVDLDLFPGLRERMNQQISQFLPSPQAELLAGITLGIKKDLPFDFRLALRDTSTLHMVVVSGQNLSLVAGLLLSLSGLLTRRVAIILTFFVITAYVILTGGQIPVLRAALMAYLANLASVLGRASDGLWVLLLIAGLLLLINPVWILDLSFQLSFLATFGVVVVAPVLLKSFKLLPIFIRSNLATTIGAQLMVLPVISQNFHQISLVSIPANLLTLWIIPYIMGGGLLFLVFSFASEILTRIFALGLSVLLTYFIYIVKFFASLPFAWEYIGEQVWIVWVGYYMVMGGVLIGLNKIK